MNELRHGPLQPERFTSVTCAAPPRPRVDRRTGEMHTDRATGLPQWEVFVLVVSEEEREPVLLGVRVGGEPAPLTIGAPVLIEDFWERKYEIEGRRGVYYTASSVTTPGASQSATPDPQGAGRVAGGKAAARE